MSGPDTAPKAGDSLFALVSARADFPKLTDKDFAKATGILVKKLLNAGGQTKDTISQLRDLVGKEIFDKELKALTDRQALMLAKRIDKTVVQDEVSSSELARLHIWRLLDGTPAEEMAPEAKSPEAKAPEAAPETAPEPAAETAATEPDAAPQPAPEPEPVAARPANAYFGRRSFRVGD